MVELQRCRTSLGIRAAIPCHLSRGSCQAGPQVSAVMWGAGQHACCAVEQRVTENLAPQTTCLSSTARCMILGTQCKMKMWGPYLRKYRDFLDGDSRTVMQAWGPRPCAGPCALAHVAH